MADNYIERRMEDMRTGRLMPVSSVRAKGGPRKGVAEFPFPPRRVLIAGGVEGHGLEVARAFLKTGCKVAVFDNDKDMGQTLAYKEGVRFHCVDLSDSVEVQKAFSNLVEAWRDVDIVLSATDKDCAEVIADCWSGHRDRYLAPLGYAGRMILLAESDSSGFAKVRGILHKHGITVNSIIPSVASTEESRSIARLCLMLSLPGNDFIDGFRIECHVSIP